MLGLWMTDVQHRRGAGLVLFQHTRSPVAHLQREVGSQLSFYILSGHLDSSGKGDGDRKETTSVRAGRQMGKSDWIVKLYYIFTSASAADLTFSASSTLSEKKYSI